MALVCLFVAFACSGPAPDTSADKAAVEKVVTTLHRALEAAYQMKKVDLAKVLDGSFAPDARVVTYWGTEEPYDTTKARMLSGVGKVANYTNAVENIESRVYGAGAVVTCIVRQDYSLSGHEIDEFLPTTYVMEKGDAGWKIVFAHRSADFQTIQQQLTITKQQQ